MAGKYRSKTTTGWNKGIKYYKEGRLSKKEYKFLRNAGLDVKIVNNRIYWRKKGYGRRFAGWLFLDTWQKFIQNLKKYSHWYKYMFWVRKPKYGTKTKSKSKTKRIF